MMLCRDSACVCFFFSCAPGFYGNPRVPGGRCHLCNCPGNSCDSLTGGLSLFFWCFICRWSLYTDILCDACWWMLHWIWCVWCHMLTSFTVCKDFLELRDTNTDEQCEGTRHNWHHRRFILYRVMLWHLSVLWLFKSVAAVHRHCWMIWKSLTLT